MTPQEKESKARQELFQQASDLFTKSGRIFLNYGTGAGKSKIALDLIEDVINNSFKQNGEVTECWDIIVPTRLLVKNWQDEITKWGKEHLLPFLHIYCHKSLHKEELLRKRNIIIDEGQWLTETTLPVVNHILDNKKLIVLTATLSKRKRELYKVLGVTDKQTVTYKLDEAVNDNLVADYKIFVVEFPLDNVKKQIEAGRKGAKYFITEQASYNLKTKLMKMSFVKGFAKFGIMQRMQFVYNLPSKLEIAQWFEQNMPASMRTIFFCGSIKQADAVGSYRYHSKTSTKDFDAFCEGKINKLAAVKSIAAGQNIPGLDAAVIVQAEEEDLPTIQKIGRASRKDGRDDKVALIFILCATGTQDNKWVNGAISSFDHNKIHYISFNELRRRGLQNLIDMYVKP